MNTRFMKFLYTILACIFLSQMGLSQENSTPVTVGLNYSFNSSVLNESCQLQVYAPDDYEESAEGYPVLYILDGQKYFLSGVAIQKALRTPRAIPNMIVVGVSTNADSRWTWFSEAKETYSNFLIDEVIPFIDSRYRTNDQNIIFGWEAGAYFASELLLKHPEAFNGAILTNGGYAAEDAVKKFSSTEDTYLYMANSKKDIYNIEETDAFHEILKAHAPQNLKWTYDLQNDEIHESLAHLALYRGLKFYYHNYNSLAFESIQDYINRGGMTYLTQYFQERAERFGGDSGIDNSTKNTLIWLAWKRDNFEYFKRFMTEFEDVLTTDRYASAYWQNRFGQFYLKHKDYPNAIKYFQAGLANYPNSRFEAQMKEGLAAAKVKD